MRKDVLVDSGHLATLTPLQPGEEISSLLTDSKVNVGSKVIIYGTVYRTGSAFLTGFDSDGRVKIGRVWNSFVTASPAVCFTLWRCM